jgi:hypothetical protein
LNRAAAVGLIAAAVLVSIAAFFALRSGGSGGDQAAPGDGEVLPPVEPGSGVIARLYFPGSDRRLHAIERELPLEGSTEDRARILILALSAGPEAAGAAPEAGLVAPLPAGMTVRHVYRPEPSVLLVDLQAPEDPAAIAMGSSQELLTVFSLVDTLALNLVGIERVGLLIGGVQQATFAGQVDTGLPLVPDRRLVAPAESAGG